MKITIALITIASARFVSQSDFDGMDTYDNTYENTYEEYMPLSRSGRDLIGYNRQHNVANNVHKNLMKPFTAEHHLEKYQQKIAEYIASETDSEKMEQFRKRLAAIRRLQTIRRRNAMLKNSATESISDS